MHRRIEHIAAELLICRSPASISNYIFSAVFTYFWGGFLRKKRWLLGLRPRPRWGSLQRSPHPLAGREGCPPPAPSPGRPRLLLRPTPCHTLAGAPPPPNSWIRHCVGHSYDRKGPKIFMKIPWVMWSSGIHPTSVNTQLRY